MSAPASGGPTREIALLIAEARPALCTGTRLMSAVVSGATMAMPKAEEEAGRQHVDQIAGRGQ